MKANSIAIFGLAAVIAMPCFALDDAVTLSRTCKKGQITSYADSTTMKAAAGEGTQTAKYRYEITEIKPNGDVVTVVHFDGGHVKSPRGEQDIPGGVDITETRDKAGRLLAWKRNVEADTFIAEEVRELMAAVSEAILPDKPVKVGDSWTTEIDNPAAKGKKIAYTTTFAGTESLDGGPKLWKLKQTAGADIEATSSKLTADRVEWIDPSTGATVKAESTLTGVPTQFGPLTLIDHVAAVKEDKK